MIIHDLQFEHVSKRTKVIYFCNGKAWNNIDNGMYCAALSKISNQNALQNIIGKK